MIVVGYPPQKINGFFFRDNNDMRRLQKPASHFPNTNLQGGTSEVGRGTSPEGELRKYPPLLHFPAFEYFFLKLRENFPAFESFLFKRE